jgi:hypothetical protein
LKFIVGFFGVIQKIEEHHYDRRIFVNLRLEKEWLNHQEKMKNIFRGENEILSKNKNFKEGPKTDNSRNLEIDFYTFIEYFQMEGSLLEKYKEDVAFDEEGKTITISDCRIIPILGTLKMLDDYKNG